MGKSAESISVEEIVALRQNNWKLNGKNTKQQKTNLFNNSK